MELVRIYDKALAEVGVCGDFTYLEYTCGFREAGAAELVIPGSSPAAALIEPDGLISVPSGEYYIVDSVERDLRRDQVQVRCRGLLSLFGGTAVGAEYGLAGDALVLLNVMARMGAENMPADFAYNAATGGRAVTFRSGRSYLIDDMVSLCYLGDVGMSLILNDGVLEFTPLLPRDRTAGTSDPVTVSGKMGTITSERVIRDHSGYRNVAVVSGAEKESGGRYTVTVRSDAIDLAGDFPDGDYFDRQMLVTFSVPLSDYTYEDDAGERIFDEAAYTEAMYAAGAAALGRCRPGFRLSGTAGEGIAPGDTVTVRDPDSGITAPAIAERVTTVYSGNTRTVSTELRPGSAVAQ